MSSELEATGERVIEEAYRRTLGGYVIYVFHAASYRFAENYCSGKRVIDLGCGSGYGAARLASIAAEVVGVDVSANAIAFAQDRYPARNLRFEAVASGEKLPFPDASFDVAISFQVIEHVADDAAYLREAKRILKPGGTLLLITPDRRFRLLPGQKPWNRWHVREYSVASLRRLISGVFELHYFLLMGADWSIAGIEIRRYRMVKWLTFPLTLPLMPELVRRRGLDLVHALLARRVKPKGHDSEHNPDFGFDETSVDIAESVQNPLNLVVVAKKSEDARDLR